MKSILSIFCIFYDVPFNASVNTWYMYTQLLEPDQISHTQSMVAKRGLTNRANVHTQMWKNRLKQHGRNSNRSSIFGCNWTSPVGIPGWNLPESSKIPQCTFGIIPLSSKCIFIDISYLALMACTSCQVVIFPHLKRWEYQFPTVPKFSQTFEDFARFLSG